MWAQLDERLPILEVSADWIVSKMGDVTAGFVVEKPEIFTLGEAEYEALHQGWVKALKTLPDGAVFHMQDVFVRDRYVAAVMSDEDSFLARANERFFDGRGYLRHTCYVFIARRPSGRRAVTSGTSGLLRRTLVPADTLDEQAMRGFESALGQFTRILEDTGMVRIRRLRTEELVSSGSKAGVIERYCYLAGDDQGPVVRDVSFGENVRVGDRQTVLFTLADAAKMPGKCAPARVYEPYSSETSKLFVGFAAGLGLLFPYNHIYNQYVVIGNVQETMNRMEAKRKRLQSLSRYSRENAVACEAADAFLNEAVAQGLRPVKFHADVLAWTEIPSEVKGMTTALGAAMAGLDAVPHHETVGAPQLWYAGIPGNAGDLPENECVDMFLEQAVCFYSLETNYRSSSDGPGIRFGDRLTGAPVRCDLIEWPRRVGLTANANFFCLSGSGGGKSYLINHMCRSYYDQGMHVLIVDVGHSYRVQCELVGGKYMAYEEDDPIKFNPFVIEPGMAFDTEKKESLKSLLMALWKRSDEAQYRSEYVALSNALEAYYAMLAADGLVRPCFNSFYEFMRDSYVDVLRGQGVHERQFDVANFLYVLSPFYGSGEFGYLLNARENLDLLNERFIVFELDNLRGHPVLLPVVTLVIMDVFVSKMRRLRGVRKMIIIEEAWKAIATEGMAYNIVYLEKTVRKFAGGIGMVTQELDDLVNSPIVRQTIINNSDIKILLDQSKFAGKFEEIQGLLGISEKQKAEILSINKGQEVGRKYKDCWISLGPTWSRVYRLETSEEEYLAYTSDQGERVLIERAAVEEGSMQLGIEALAKKRRKKS